MATKTVITEMLPYRRQGEIDYAALNFDADETEVPVDHMEQNREIHEIIGLFTAWFTDFNRRPDMFVDTDTNICYNPRNLNVRVAPDVYIAFGVDAEAIRPRKIYLPWEVGKPPDWVLEIASESTSRQDVNRKPAIYAQIGVPEYWRFDPTGGRYHGAPLYGGRLAGVTYAPIPLTTEPDGILKGYSEILQLSLCWDQGWPALYNPAAGEYLENWRQVWHDREAQRAARAEADARAAEATARANAAEAEIRRLRRRLGEL